MRKQIDTSIILTPTPGQWEELNRLYLELSDAGRRMILLGVKCLLIKEPLPYGEFNRELAARCPNIHRRSLYRAMKAAKNVMQALSCAHVHNSDALAQMVEALEGTGEPELLAEIDALIQGKSGRQLVLAANVAQEMTSAEEDAKEKCLTHFEEHTKGPANEAKWRMAAEAGELPWTECWRNCSATISKRGDIAAPLDPKRVAKLLESGLVRLEQWGSQEAWAVLSDQDRAKFSEDWRRSLASLSPDLRVIALTELRKKGGES